MDSAKSKQGRAETAASPSARPVLKAAPADGVTMMRMPTQPWQQTYRTIQEAIDAVLEWRAVLAPEHRPSQYQVSRVPGFEDRFMVAPVWEGKELVFLVAEEAMLEHEEMLRKRKHHVALRSYLHSCVE